MNYYPNKPVLDFERTIVNMDEVVQYLREAEAEREIKIASYVIFRNESSNGKSGINNNYIGAQADAGMWPEKFNDTIQGIVEKEENRTGKSRLFLAFDSFKTSVDFLLDRVQQRGLFVGGTPHQYYFATIRNAADLALAYYREWVEGESRYQATEEEINDFKSMYNQGEELI